jgi:4-amino-4-deoxy-L-arabinose transferase-like glycosyltransferase
MRLPKSDRVSCVLLMKTLRQSPVVGLTLLGTLLFQIVTFWALQWQPLTADEGEFMLAALDWPARRSLIPHPQLYVHALQAAFLLWGESVTAARMVNLLANLATTLLLLPLTAAVLRRQLPPERIPHAQISALLLWAACPLVIQNQLLLDIDNGILTTALTGTLLLWYALEPTRPLLRTAATGAGFALALWSKLPTPPMLMAGMVLFYLLQRRGVQAAQAAAAAACGIALFLFTHLLYSHWTGYTLSQAASGLAGRTATAESALATVPSVALQSTGVFLFWITLPLALLTLLAVGRTLHNFQRSQLQEVDLLVLLVAGIALFYGTLIVPAWGYPRYHTPGYALLCVVAGSTVASAGLTATRRTLLTFGLVLAGALLAQLFTLGDPLYAIYRATFETVQLNERLAVAAPPALIQLAILAGGVGAATLLLRGTPLPLASRLCLALFALTLGLFIATHWAQLRADYSTRYRYTYLYADRQRAIEYVNQNVPDDGFLLADKDILWYATRPGEPIYPYLQPTAFVARLQAGHVDALVWAEKEWLKSGIKNDPQSLHLLEACFEVKQFGIFFVAMRTDSCAVLP